MAEIATATGAPRVTSRVPGPAASILVTTPRLIFLVVILPGRSSPGGTVCAILVDPSTVAMRRVTAIVGGMLIHAVGPDAGVSAAFHARWLPTVGVRCYYSIDRYREATMTKTISATEARIHFGEVLRGVTERGETIFVERSGKPLAVVLSIEEYERLRNGDQKEDWWDL